jgi:hypothetical protein
VSAYRKGYVLHMWTRLFENERTGRPIVFSSVKSAQRALARYPAWGRDAVAVYEVRVRPGSNGRPDFILGERVSSC